MSLVYVIVLKRLDFLGKTFVWILCADDVEVSIYIRLLMFLLGLQILN